MYGLAAATAAMSILLSQLTNSSPQSSFSLLNLLQLYLLLPLIGPYIPDDVINFLSGLDITLISFYFFKIEDSNMFSSLSDKFSYPQNNSYLYLLNFKDGSTILNLINVCTIILIIPVLHTLVTFIKLIVSSDNDMPTCKKVLGIIFNWMTFGLYIRTIMEIYLSLLFASLSEIHNTISGLNSNKVSAAIAGLVAGGCLLAVVVALYQ